MGHRAVMRQHDEYSYRNGFEMQDSECVNVYSLLQTLY